MGAAAIPLIVGGATVAGGIYSANKQDSAAKRQEQSLRDSQSTSREDMERGKLELREQFGEAMWTIEAMTPEIIQQLQDGQLTTSGYLTQNTDAANKILGDGARDYKNELLGRSSQAVSRGPDGSAIPVLGGAGNQPIQGQQSAEYGLGAATESIENARFNAAQDITQGRDTARGDLQRAATQGRRGLVEDFGSARDEITRARDLSTRGISDASTQSQRQLGQLGTDTRNLINQSEQQQLGLLGSGQQGIESALRGGYQDAMTSEQQGYGDARRDLQSALGSAQGISASTGALSPYSQAGAQATELELALSGAAGPEAQAEAYANFEESAGQKFLRERQEQTLLRNSAATGGLQGGRVLGALQEQGAGIAAQDLQRQVGNLQSLSGRGLQAAGQISSLGTQAGMARGQLSANIQSKLADLSRSTGLSRSQLQRTLGDKLANVQGQYTGAESQLRQGNTNQQLQNMQNTAQGQIGLNQQAAQGIAGLETGAADRLYQSLQQQGLSRNQIEQVLGGNLAGLETDAARQLAGNQMQAGGAIGNMQMGVGQQLAGNTGQLSQLQAANMGSLGTNLANLNDRTNTNIVNVLQERMNQRAGLQSNLGTNLANISVGQGTNALNYANQLAQASGLRDMASANKVTSAITGLGNLASNIDWGSMGDGGTQQQPTGQSAISDDTFIRGTNEWGTP